MVDRTALRWKKVFFIRVMERGTTPDKQEDEPSGRE
jgi:hypothetical protein